MLIRDYITLAAGYGVSVVPGLGANSPLDWTLERVEVGLTEAHQDLRDDPAK